jgi:hypothetical protein
MHIHVLLWCITQLQGAVLNQVFFETLTDHEIPCFICNPEVYRRIHKRQINPAHTLMQFLMIHFSNILLFSPRSSKISLSFRSPHETHVCTSLFRACYMLLPYRSCLFDHPSSICWAVEMMKLRVTYSSPFSLYRLPLRTKIFLSTWFSNILSVYFSRSVRDRVSNICVSNISEMPSQHHYFFRNISFACSTG